MIEGDGFAPGSRGVCALGFGKDETTPVESVGLLIEVRDPVDDVLLEGG